MHCVSQTKRCVSQTKQEKKAHLVPETVEVPRETQPTSIRERHKTNGITTMRLDVRCRQRPTQGTELHILRWSSSEADSMTSSTPLKHTNQCALQHR